MVWTFYIFPDIHDFEKGDTPQQWVPWLILGPLPSGSWASLAQRSPPACGHGGSPARQVSSLVGSGKGSADHVSHHCLPTLSQPNQRDVSSTLFMGERSPDRAEPFLCSSQREVGPHSPESTGCWERGRVLRGCGWEVSLFGESVVPWGQQGEGFWGHVFSCCRAVPALQLGPGVRGGPVVPELGAAGPLVDMVKGGG